MARSIFNLDNAAFSVSTQGVMQPHLISRLQVEEDDAVVNPHNFQPLGAPRERSERNLAIRDTDESSLDSIMALADDLKTFQEFEGYRYPKQSDSESDAAPQDYPSDDEASMEETFEIEAGQLGISRSTE